MGGALLVTDVKAAEAAVQRQPKVFIISGRMSGIHDSNWSEQGITAMPFPGHDIRVEVPAEPRTYHRRRDYNRKARE